MSVVLSYRLADCYICTGNVEQVVPLEQDLAMGVDSQDRPIGYHNTILL